MHWVLDYPWGATGTWLMVAAVVTVLAASFALVWRELWPFSVASLLIVLLRLGALAVIVYLLVQPSVLLKKTEEVQPHVAVLVDTSGSMSSVDVGRSRTRLDEALEALDRSGIVEAMSEKSRLSVYEFSTGLSKIQREKLDELSEAAGAGTSIGLALAQLRDEFKGEDLAAAVLLSDGRDNTGINPEDAARDLAAPVFAVGFGRAKPEEVKEKEKDLAIVDLDHDKRVVVGHTTDVKVTVAMKGFDARTVPVELLLDGEVVRSSAVALSPNRPQRYVTMEISPPAPGQYVFSVRVPPEQGEGNTANNEKPVPIFVADPVARVLYVEARPRWEFKFVSRVLQAYKNIEHTSVVRLAPDKQIIQGTRPAEARRIARMTPAQLRRLKAIIIGDVPRNFFTTEQLRTIAALVDQGMAVMLLAGPESFGAKGFADTPLAGVLPCELHRRVAYVEKRVRVHLTPEGKAHPAFQGVDHDWTKAPELISLVGVGAVKPGATVLMETHTRPAEPVVIAHRYGRGKACVVLTDSTWRWKLGMAEGTIETDLQAIFWRQLIQWLMPEPQEEKEKRAVQLVADKLSYELNEQVNLTVTAVDAEGNTARDAKVTCTIEAPDGKVIERQATFGKIPGAGADAEGFTASFTTHVSGRYKVVATAQADGQDLGRDQVAFVVGDTSIEMTETDPDRELLEAVARRSGGEYFEPENASQIPDRIPIETRTNTWTETREVWNRWEVFLIFLGLVSAEWVVRRSRQLE
ncbi:MAG: glutamine amidotransferase [Planctomycetota bacterium]